MTDTLCTLMSVSRKEGKVIAENDFLLYEQFEVPFLHTFVTHSTPIQQPYGKLLDRKFHSKAGETQIMSKWPRLD